ncbi:D-sedoheptulose-7-phosphate isomerase [Chromobacterium paludis]|uniref:SIS domain-containing protein n=1 Tax=Chromobacterium paludis TaxID=2605945 RepID=A0A5C1DM14_9NEIS|nr:SIS domain-containing protein [Chromobacterium paludis]QEL57714.1 SIS domain-containing protein [Chromobacterium paludis]
MSTNFTVTNYFAAHAFLGQKIDTVAFQKGIDMIKAAFDSGKKIITCGNGGSASTASHYITDWNKMVHLTTGKKFRGVSLCDNVGLITAYGNDLAYSDVFSGQVDALMDEGDLLVAVSGSGNSPNVIKAIEAAKKSGGIVLGVVGYDGGKMMPMCDHNVWVQSFDMQLCEDVHLMFGHMVMKTLCNFSIK